MTVDELVAGIMGLTVNLASVQPALHQPVTLLWGIGLAYRGEPRIMEWEKVQRGVQKLLEVYGREEERARADYPVAALYHAGLWEVDSGGMTVPRAHGDSALKHWFTEHRPRSGLTSSVYELAREDAASRVAAVGAILERFFPDTDYVGLLEAVGLAGAGIAAGIGEPGDTEYSRSPLEDVYRRLCGIAARDRRGSGRRVAEIGGRYVRSAAARQAVFERGGGRCENPDCSGQAKDVTDSGDAILEIDHIWDLGLGGKDDPVQMIALCPNCHAIKTRGSTRKELRRELLVLASQRHHELLARNLAFESGDVRPRLRQHRPQPLNRELS